MHRILPKLRAAATSKSRSTRVAHRGVEELEQRTTRLARETTTAGAGQLMKPSGTADDIGDGAGDLEYRPLCCAQEPTGEGEAVGA